MERVLRTLSIVGTAGMFLVLLMGATVTDTGSGTGCGRSWPLCHGNFLPAGIRESVIEFSHRAITGVIGIVIVALAVIAIRERERYPQLLPLVPIMVGSLLLQSVMGAWAVKYPQSAPVLALHFGFSLIAVAGVFLVMRVVGESGTHQPPRRPPASTMVMRANWASLLAIYIVAYSGAYMKHAGAEQTCKTWPLCNGQIYPGFSGDDGIAFLHRLAVLGGILFIAFIAWLGYQNRRERPDLFNVSLLALVLILGQAIVGMMVVRTDMQLVSTLIHAGMMTCLFLTLCEGCRLTIPQRLAASRGSVPLHAQATTTPAD
jgi:cytochrome c oxidase assembly protein subunit 15